MSEYDSLQDLTEMGQIEDIDGEWIEDPAEGCFQGSLPAGE